MEIHQLRYAVAVAQEGTFRRAALRCAVSQPSLSAQVKKLEEELGGRLFDRLGRRTRLTPLGVRFLPHAQAILQRLESARISVAEGLEEEAGEFRLGIIPTVAPFWLPRVLPAIKRALPAAKLIVLEQTTDELVRLLGSGDLDSAVFCLPVTGPNLIASPLLKEEFLLVLPAAHPLARRRELSLEQVAKEPWILMTEPHCLRDQVADFWKRKRRRIDTILETGQVESLIGLVGAGLGVSMVPEMAFRRREDVVYRRLSPPRPGRTVALVRHRDHFQTPVARKFTGLLQRVERPRKAGRKARNDPPGNTGKR